MITRSQTAAAAAAAYEPVPVAEIVVAEIVPVPVVEPEIETRELLTREMVRDAQREAADEMIYDLPFMCDGIQEKIREYFDDEIREYFDEFISSDEDRWGSQTVLRYPEDLSQLTDVSIYDIVSIDALSSHIHGLYKDAMSDFIMGRTTPSQLALCKALEKAHHLTYGASSYSLEELGDIRVETPMETELDPATIRANMPDPCDIYHPVNY